ncbi:MAG: hypothetical protein IIX02_03515, partial [Clostridia bacterium]|nr:hypothetical protein [Clostridia bacterium]
VSKFPKQRLAFMQVLFWRSHELGIASVGSRVQLAIWHSQGAFAPKLFEGPLWGIEIPETTLLFCKCFFWRSHELVARAVGSRGPRLF